MGLVRFFLIVVLTATASLSGAMEASHSIAADHGHEVTETAADDQSLCCDDSTERGKSCHGPSAVLADAGGEVSAPEQSDALFYSFGLLLTGSEPSGPLDPPRLA